MEALIKRYMETFIKNFIENHRESLNRLIEGGKEKVRNGEMTEREYEIYLRLTFQDEVESLLETKFDTAIPN